MSESCFKEAVGPRAKPSETHVPGLESLMWQEREKAWPVKAAWR